jgi:hypothetical protein
MDYKGAGGTSGGAGKFVIGLLMFMVGIYLLLKNINVSNSFSLGYGIFNAGGFSVTSGMILIPFILGVGMIFFNYRNIIGWVLAAGSIALFIIGIITSIHFSLNYMSSFDLIMILVLMVGGLGLFLSSLRSSR